MSESSERLWFSTVIEAVFIKGLGAKMTPKLKAELRAAHIDLDRLQPAYPVESVKRVFKVVVTELYAGVDEAEALRQLGAQSMKGYGETLIGKALLQILKLIGVRRSLLRMHTSMRSGNNYLETFSNVVGPNCIELRFSDVTGMPSFYQGILEEGGRMAHARNLRVTTAVSEPPGHTFRVEWDD
ncbi:MAG: DUF2378 family protein [Myxococcota bacterium]